MSSLDMTWKALLLVMMPSIPDALHGRVGSCRYDITLPGERWNLESRKRLKCWKDTPWKFCIDTKNDGLEDVSHFKNCYFGYLVMMVRKQDHRSYSHLPHHQQHEHEHHHYYYHHHHQIIIKSLNHHPRRCSLSSWPTTTLFRLSSSLSIVIATAQAWWHWRRPKY